MKKADFRKLWVLLLNFLLIEYTDDLLRNYGLEVVRYLQEGPEMAH